MGRARPLPGSITGSAHAHVGGPGRYRIQSAHTGAYASPFFNVPRRFRFDFLRNCPLLEVAFLRCEIFDLYTDSDEVVSLPLLRSFTHESHSKEYELLPLD